MKKSKMLGSKVAAFRIWAEKKVAKRAENYLRVLYLKHPEKFGKIEYEHSNKKRMRLAKANYILSEMISQKSISLKDECDDHIDRLEDFKNRFTGEVNRFALQKNTITDLTQDDHSGNSGPLELENKKVEQ
ncbi:MAG: hypothetical protein AAGE99_03130 [Chlamydiota bacterium]